MYTLKGLILIKETFSRGILCKVTFPDRTAAPLSMWGCSVLRCATFPSIAINSKTHHNGEQLNCIVRMETVKGGSFLALGGFPYQENDFIKHISQLFTGQW